MNEPGCGIIQDLLLSYSDGLTGENITEMIEEHLTECEKCRRKLQELKQNRELAEDAEASRGRNFGEKLKSMRFYFIGIIIGLCAPIGCLVVCALITGVISYFEIMLYSYFL